MNKLTMAMKQGTAKNFNLLESPIEGTNLIEASAGTGKTFTIAALFLRLLLEKRCLVEEILVVTYTVAATEELRDRIRRKIRGAIDALSTGKIADDPFLAQWVPGIPHPEEAKQRLQDALHDFDRASIFTIHGFCQRLLYEKAFETGSLFDLELLPEEENNLREEVVCDFWRRHFYQAPLEMVGYARSLKFSPDFFLKVASQTRGHLDFEIVPSLKSVPLSSLPGFQKVLEDLAGAWPKARDEVSAQLRMGSLNLRQYGDPEKLLLAMDAFLSAPGPKFPPFKDFFKFTASKIKESTKKNQPPPRHPFFDLAEEGWKKSEDLKRDLDQHLLFLKGELFRYLSSELPRRKQRRNVQSFDDLLIRVRRSLEKEGGEDLSRSVRTRFRAALVDEFQDTDPTQYAIFQKIFGAAGSLLFLIGDPKQAIYSFRGADLFAYLQAARRVGHRYTLTKNWRSGPDLVKAVNTVFSRVEAPFLYGEIGFAPAESGKRPGAEELAVEGENEPSFHLWWVDKGRTGEEGKSISKGKAQKIIQQGIAAEVARLVDLGRKGRACIGPRPLQEEDIAILVRTNRQARIIQEALLSLRIPCVLHSTGYLFDTPESLEMKRVLAGIAEPHNERLVRAALTTDLLGVTGEEMDRLLTDESQWEDWLFRFREYYEVWEKKGFIRMFQRFLRDEKVRSRLLALPDGERRLTNVLHLGEVLNREAINQKLGVSRLWQWLAHQIDPSTPRLEEHLLRLESDARAIKIVTIHKSKGLEYPIVFCPFNWEGSEIEEGKEYLFHDPGDQGKLKLVLDSGGNGNRTLAQKELLAENLRLLYVALTRAKNRCYLLWGRFKDAETSALAYLLHPAQAPGDDLV
ncbi:MAG: UvrD-helicase domain-containing protein, partial [Deltaproteobacteria bacterium]|nr:UvrD-helicase domain-containing protein [Deltaproteobacteria bacterium]